MADILLGNIKGPPGPKGEIGTGLKVLDYYTTVEELSAAITNPSVGDAYGVGSAYPYDIYIYSQSNGWVNNGVLQGAKGEDGIDGTNATITDVTAAVDESTGTPTVTVTMGGTESKRSLAFSFSGLKGEKGPQGEKGEKGEPGESANVDINEQTPTYTEATTLEPLTSGEKIGIAFGKIKKAITDFISHLGNKSNPHGVSASQIGALPITGGTIYGYLGASADSYPGIEFRTPNTAAVIMKNAYKDAEGNYFDHGLIISDYDKASQSESVSLILSCGSVTDNNSEMTSALRIASILDGQARYYNIFGDHNREAMGIAKIETGAYVGTGTYGEEHPNRLTFSIEPKIVIVYCDRYHAGVSDEIFGNVAFGYGRQVFYKGASIFETEKDGSDGTSYYTEYVLNGNVLEWYYEYNDALHQMNSTGVTYHYIAIG